MSWCRCGSRGGCCRGCRSCSRGGRRSRSCIPVLITNYNAIFALDLSFCFPIFWIVLSRPIVFPCIQWPCCFWRVWHPVANERFNVASPRFCSGARYLNPARPVGLHVSRLLWRCPTSKWRRVTPPLACPSLDHRRIVSGIGGGKMVIRSRRNTPLVICCRSSSTNGAQSVKLVAGKNCLSVLRLAGGFFMPALNTTWAPGTSSVNSISPCRQRSKLMLRPTK